MTKVLPLLVVSTTEGYDTILRVLAQENLNSRLLIPVQGSPYIEDLTKEDLSHFGAILLYNYKYKKEANFKTIRRNHGINSLLLLKTAVC